MDRQPQEDLALIRRFMEETRQEVVDRGQHFVLWGGISGAGLIATYMAATGRAALDPAWVWVALLAVGWAASFVIGWRAGRGSRVQTTGRRVLNAVWVSAAVTLTLVGLAGMFARGLSHVALPGVLSAVIAIPILVTGLLTGERWLGWVAVAWWIGGAVMLFAPGVYTLLVMAAMAVLLLGVPGGILRARVDGRRRRLEAPGAP